MIRVVFADDHQLFLEGACSLLEAENNIKVVGVANTGEGLLRIAAETSIDIAIVDISMPGIGGIEAVKSLKKEYPDIGIVVLTTHNRAEYILSLRDYGVDSYILKNMGVRELVKSIEAVSKGESYFSYDVMKVVMDNLGKKEERPSMLTFREEQVLKQIASGFNTKEIASELHISASTVDTHRRNLLNKLELRNSLQLVRFAIENGFSDSENLTKN